MKNNSARGDRRLSHKLAIALLIVIALNLATGCVSAQSATGEITVHFIDVGQADSALIICEGATMLIDGGNAADSSLIYAYLQDHGITHLNYIVATHAHEDHVGGLAGALNYATVDIALCPVTEYDSRAFNSFVKYLDEQGVSITVPAHGDTFMLGGAEVLIVGPVNQSDSPNNTSIVMKITYGEISFLFTGDAERVEEMEILDAGYDVSATVLKVGHHGSNTSSSYQWIYYVNPRYAVVSCGRNNPYGHPHEEVMSRLRDADIETYRTDMQGHIVCMSDGRSVSFSTEKNADVQTNPTAHIAAGEIYYIGNVNSKKFHKISCSGLPAEHNRVSLDSREAAIGAGYEPCGICRP